AVRWERGPLDRDQFGRPAGGGNVAEAVRGPEVTERVVAGAESHRMRNDRIEHWLHVGFRSADHPEHFARRRLLLERLAELPPGRLQLRKSVDLGSRPPRHAAGR